MEKVDTGNVSRGIIKPVRKSTKTKYKGTKTGFAWNVGAGALYQINSDVALDLSYRYRNLGKISAKEEQGENKDEKYTARLKSHNVMLGVVYNF